MFTWFDMIEQVVSKAQAAGIGVPLTMIARATGEAYAELGIDLWNHVDTVEHIDVYAALSKKASYNGAGVVTLDAAEADWPSWVVGQIAGLPVEGVIRPYFIQAASARTLTLAVPYYTASIDSFTCQVAQACVETSDDLDYVFNLSMNHVRARPVMYSRVMEHYQVQFAGQPAFFAVRENPYYKRGRRVIWLAPAPSRAGTVDVAYSRRPRILLATGVADRDIAGTVSLTVGSKVVQGTQTNFRAQEHEGAILRISESASPPDGLYAKNRYIFEAKVASVDSATQLTLETAPTQAYTAVKYRLSSHVDVPKHIWRYLLCRAWSLLTVEFDMKLHQAALLAERNAKRAALELERGTGDEGPVLKSPKPEGGYVIVQPEVSP